jgi:ATP-dependent Clp protease ATP-binding subunit ClpB
MGELRRNFRPEFLNRVDDIVLFKPLTVEEIKDIVLLLVKDLQKRLESRRLNLQLSDAAVEFIARSAYEPVYGARPLKRYLQHELETRIGRAVIQGDILEGETIFVDEKDGVLCVRHSRPDEKTD